MICENQQEHATSVAAKAADTPYNASGFEFHGGPIPFISEGCLADVENRADGSVRLLLLECCSETIGAGIAV